MNTLKMLLVKKLILTSLFLFIVISVYSQDKFLQIDFEKQDWKNYIRFDTSSENIWMVGKPSKVLFDTAFSAVNAIMTDTSFSYPINNISRFYFTDNANMTGLVQELIFYFKINSDTLCDFLNLDVSFNKGKTWHAIFSDSNDSKITYMIQDYLNPSDFNWGPFRISGNIVRWKLIIVDVGLLHYLDYHDEDTVIFRFSFISDVDNNNMEGVIIDNISLFNDDSSVEENDKSGIELFPNPAYNNLIIKSENYSLNNLNVSVFNIYGVEETSYFNHPISEPIDISHLKPGLYLLRLTNGSKIIETKIILKN